MNEMYKEEADPIANKLMGWAQVKVWTEPSDLVYDGQRHKAWARSRFKSEKATEWTVVDLPFRVTERISVMWPGRMGAHTSFEPWMEYRPIDDEPKKKE